MKLDKEFLTKQRFWLLLSLAVPLVLVAFVLLFFVVPAEARREKKKVEDAIKNAKGKSDFKNEKHVKAAQKEADRAKALETQVWVRAWQQQRDEFGRELLRWPDSMEKQFPFQKGLFANAIAIQGKEANLDNYPKDTPQLFHGVLTTITKEYIEVQGRKSKQKFYRTAKPKITSAEAADKEMSLEEFGAYADKRALVAVTFQQGKYFGDDLTDSERFLYMKTYKDQIREALEEAGPLNALEEPLVQFRGWTFPNKGKKYVWKDSDFPPAGAKFLRYVAGQWKDDADISEEAWTAQEDLCIQREMFRLVRQANQYVAEFVRTNEETNPKVFKGKNPYWEIELELKPNDKLHVKLVNRLPRRQRVDVRFQVRFEEGKPFQVIPRLDAEPLAAHGMVGEDKDPKNPKVTRERNLDTHEDVIDVKPFRPKGIFGVEQVLTWETAAVKRIDQISFGISGPVESSHSHRTADRPLVPYRKKAVEDKPMETTDPMMGDEGRPMVVPPIGREGVPGPEGGPVVAGQSPNGLILNRYLSVTPQARRVPVAIALIVDQEHVHRVLSSFANSKLRFLITQVVWHRYPQSVRPPDGPIISEPGDPNDPTRPPMLEGRPPPVPLPGPREGFEGRPEDGMRPSAAAGSDEQEANVELVIYGVATLYERYPPRQQPTTGEPDKK